MYYPMLKSRLIYSTSREVELVSEQTRRINNYIRQVALTRSGGGC